MNIRWVETDEVETGAYALCSRCGEQGGHTFRSSDSMAEIIDREGRRLLVHAEGCLMDYDELA